VADACWLWLQVDVLYLHNPAEMTSDPQAPAFQKRLEVAFTWLEQARAKGSIRCPTRP